MDGRGIGREGSVLVMYEVSRGFSATAFTEQVLYRVSMEEVALAQFYVTLLIVDSTVREARNWRRSETIWRWRVVFLFFLPERCRPLGGEKQKSSMTACMYFKSEKDSKHRTVALL